MDTLTTPGPGPEQVPDGEQTSRQILLPGLGALHCSERHVLFIANQPMQATSSCVWNGGNTRVSGWLNLKVSATGTCTHSPATTLQQYAASMGYDFPMAGMMTAASMASLRLQTTGDKYRTLACMVTAGIQNARRSGDRHDGNDRDSIPPGTINIALACNAGFTPAARIEALMIATEAKTAACYDLNIVSPVSHQPATGTGTDALCLLSSESADALDYCGKHTVMGEWIGSATYAAVYQSLQACVALQRQQRQLEPG